MWIRLGLWAIGALGLANYFSDEEKVDDGFIGPIPIGIDDIPTIPKNQDFWKYTGGLSVLWLLVKYRPWK